MHIRYICRHTAWNAESDSELDIGIFLVCIATVSNVRIVYVVTVCVSSSNFCKHVYMYVCT